MVTSRGALYAPTTQGGRVRLDAIEWAERPFRVAEGREHADEWYIPVGIGSKTYTIGHFPTKEVAEAFCDRYFPAVALDEAPVRAPEVHVGMTPDYIVDNFAMGHEFETERRAFAATVDPAALMAAFKDALDLQLIDEACSEAMYRLGYVDPPWEG